MAEHTALITGGTRGIGFGIARALAEEGWSLALGGMRSESDARPALDELRALGAVVHYVRGDLAQRDDRRRIAAEARAALGPINALINNAGRGPRVRADLLEATEDSFEELLSVNLQGPYFLTQAIARDQIERRCAMRIVQHFNQRCWIGECAGRRQRLIQKNAAVVESAEIDADRAGIDADDPRH